MADIDKLKNFAKQFKNPDDFERSINSISHYAELFPGEIKPNTFDWIKDIDWHATLKDKEVEKAIKTGKLKTGMGQYGEGFYLAGGKGVSENIVRQIKGGGTPKSFPFDTSNLKLKELTEDELFGGHGRGTYIEAYNAAKKAGYDGIHLTDIGEKIVFNPEKLKSIDLKSIYEQAKNITAESTAKTAYKGALKKGEGVADMEIYHGKNPGQKSDNWFTPSKKEALYYTKSFKDSEIEKAKISPKDIYKPLNIQGTHDEGAKTAIKEAIDKGYKAVEISEGNFAPKSVYVIDRSILKQAYKGALKKGLKSALIAGGGMALGALMSPPVQAAQTILENPEEANPVPEYGTLHSQVEQPYLYTNKVQNQVGLPNGQMPNPANYNIDVRKQAYKNMRSKW